VSRASLINRLTSSSTTRAVSSDISGPSPGNSGRPSRDRKPFWPKATGPSFSLIPNSTTMARAISVARWRSSEAPVEISWNTSSSATRPPRANVKRSFSSGSVTM
jgi:hypothetical protein